MDGVGADQVPIIAVEALLKLVTAVERIAGRARGAVGDEEPWATGLSGMSPPVGGDAGVAGPSGGQSASGSTAVGSAVGAPDGRGADDDRFSGW
jgi:hypothetical protein